MGGERGASWKRTITITGMQWKQMIHFIVFVIEQMPSVHALDRIEATLLDRLANCRKKGCWWYPEGCPLSQSDCIKMHFVFTLFCAKTNKSRWLGAEEKSLFRLPFKRSPLLALLLRSAGSKWKKEGNSFNFVSGDTWRIRQEFKARHGITWRCPRKNVEICASSCWRKSYERFRCHMRPNSQHACVGGNFSLCSPYEQGKVW